MKKTMTKNYTQNPGADREDLDTVHTSTLAATNRHADPTNSRSCRWKECRMKNLWKNTNAVAIASTCLPSLRLHRKRRHTHTRQARNGHRRRQCDTQEEDVRAERLRLGFLPQAGLAQAGDMDILAAAVGPRGEARHSILALYGGVNAFYGWKERGAGSASVWPLFVMDMS